MWGRAWQPHPLVLVAWAANCHHTSTPGQPRLVMGRELSCSFPFWNLKGGDGEVPCRGSAGAQCMGLQRTGVQPSPRAGEWEAPGVSLSRAHGSITPSALRLGALGYNGDVGEGRSTQGLKAPMWFQFCPR